MLYDYFTQRFAQASQHLTGGKVGNEGMEKKMEATIVQGLGFVSLGQRERLEFLIEGLGGKQGRRNRI